MAKQSMHRHHIKLQIMFSTCRSKRYAIILCAPRFRELSDWLAVDRSLFLIKTFSQKVGDNPYHPGFYVGWGKKKKRKMYYWEKARRYDMVMKIQGTQTARFPHWMPFDENEYEKHKIGALKRADAAENTSRRQLTENKGWFDGHPNFPGEHNAFL